MCLLSWLASRRVEATAQFIHDALAQDVPNLRALFESCIRRRKERLFTHGIGFQFTRFLWMAMIFAVASLMKGEIRDFSLAMDEDTILGGGFCYISL